MLTNNKTIPHQFFLISPSYNSEREKEKLKKNANLSSILLNYSTHKIYYIKNVIPVFFSGSLKKSITYSINVGILQSRVFSSILIAFKYKFVSAGSMTHVGGFVNAPTKFMNGPKSGTVRAQNNIVASTPERISTR